jgi:hypothetical protein
MLAHQDLRSTAAHLLFVQLLALLRLLGIDLDALLHGGRCIPPLLLLHRLLSGSLEHVGLQRRGRGWGGAGGRGGSGGARRASAGECWRVLLAPPGARAGACGCAPRVVVAAPPPSPPPPAPARGAGATHQFVGVLEGPVRLVEHLERLPRVLARVLVRVDQHRDLAVGLGDVRVGAGPHRAAQRVRRGVRQLQQPARHHRRRGVSGWRLAAAGVLAAQRAGCWAWGRDWGRCHRSPRAAHLK